MADDSSDAGKIVWTIDADDVAFNRKMDAAEARARAFDARVNGGGGFTGSSGVGPGAVSPATFGGIELASGNYTAGPKGPAISMAFTAVPLSKAEVSPKGSQIPILPPESIRNVVSSMTATGQPFSRSAYEAAVLSAQRNGSLGADPGSSMAAAMEMMGGTGVAQAQAFHQASISGGLQAATATAQTGTPDYSSALASRLAKRRAGDYRKQFYSVTDNLARPAEMLGESELADASPASKLPQLSSRDLTDEPRGGHRFSWLQVVGFSLAGLHEGIHATRTLNESDYAASIATSPEARLAAVTQGQQTAWSGAGASIGGLALDLFGRGPSSFSVSAQEAANTAKSQLSLRAAQSAAYFANQGFSAVSSGDSVEGDRAQARGEYYADADSINPRLREINKQLQATKFVPSHVAQRAAGPFAGIVSSMLGKDVEEPAVSGQARLDLQSQRDALALQLGQSGNKFNSDMARIQRMVSDRGFANDRLAAATIGLGAGRAGISLERQAAIGVESTNAARDADLGQYRNSADYTQRGYDVRAASWQAKLDVDLHNAGAAIQQRNIANRTALSVANARTPIEGLRAAMMGQTESAVLNAGGIGTEEGQNQSEIGKAQIDRLNRNFLRETELINIAQAGQATSIQRRFDRNPVGAQVSDMATAAIAQAQSYANDGRITQASNTLNMAMSNVQLSKREYLESFRAVQYDLRENSVSPRDQEDMNKVWSSMKESLDEIVKRLDGLEKE